MSASVAFKTCRNCQASWATCEEFVQDPALSLRGYQADFREPGQGLLLVNHAVQGCGTTLGIHAHDLRHLYRGPTYMENKAESEACLLLCVEEGRLEECTVECGMAWVREVMQHLRRHELPAHLRADLTA